MLEGLLQPTHLWVIFGIALLVFGPKKLPELGKGIGEGIRGFKSAMKEHVDASDKTTIADHDSSINDCDCLRRREASGFDSFRAHRLFIHLAASARSLFHRLCTPDSMA